VLPYQKTSSISDTFVQLYASFLVKKCNLSFVEPIKRIWSRRICSLVGMYQERLFPVCDFDV